MNLKLSGAKGYKRIGAFNLFEVCWLVAVVALLTFFILFFPDLMFDDTGNILIVVCSVISIIGSPICELLISKQSRYWTIFSFFFVETVDIVVLFGMQLYSSALISLCFWMPFDLITFFRWKSNVDEEKTELTKVKTFRAWQDVVIVLALGGGALLLGFILSHFTSNSAPYAVAFSNVFEIANGAFLLMRHNEQWIAWMGYLICEIVIWISLGHYIMLITVFAMIINTVYGFVKWLLYIKSKKSAASATACAA